MDSKTNPTVTISSGAKEAAAIQQVTKSLAHIKKLKLSATTDEQVLLQTQINALETLLGEHTG